jgi:hypothetical protein
MQHRVPEDFAEQLFDALFEMAGSLLSELASILPAMSQEPASELL